MIRADRTRLTILIATLGYFVDLFDLVLFSLVRVQSLHDLEVPSAAMLSTGVFLISVQMAGFIVGGIFWGVLGDRRGRLSVLIGSIILYSIANIANAYVDSVNAYAVWRFIAGVGLAGELGAGVTIVSELLPQKIRGYGSTIIATVGVFGAVAAALVADLVSWRHAYLLGGIIGLLLLGLRLGVQESTLFVKLRGSPQVVRGHLWAFVRRGRLMGRAALVVLMGIPIWFMIGVLVTFTPEFSNALHMGPDLPRVTSAVMYLYLGFAVGDLFVGLISQALRSRRAAILIALGFIASLLLAYPHVAGRSVTAYYTMCFLLGCGSGYWAMFVLVAAEQFGTNYRATVTTSVPNLVRGATIPMSFAFKHLIPSWGVIGSGLIVGFTTVAIAVTATLILDETFHRELDYCETV